LKIKGRLVHLAHFGLWPGQRLLPAREQLDQDGSAGAVPQSVLGRHAHGAARGRRQVRRVRQGGRVGACEERADPAVQQPGLGRAGLGAPARRRGLRRHRVAAHVQARGHREVFDALAEAGH